MQSLPPPSAVDLSPQPSSVGHQALHLLELTVAFLGIVLCMGGLVHVYAVGTSQDPHESLSAANRIFQLLSGGIFGTSLLLLLPRWHEVADLLFRNKALVLLMLIVVMSSLWAIEPGVTLRRAIALFLSTGFAVWLALRFSPIFLLKLTTVALAVLGIVSLLVIFGKPSLGIHDLTHEGRWRGVFGHKNTMGRMMSIALVLSVVWASLPGSNRIVLCGLIAMFALLTIMASSATAIVATVLALGALSAGHWVARNRLPGYLLVPMALIGGIVFTFLLLSFIGPVLEALGRDPTLSGRTKLWALAITEGMPNSLLGAGYRSFWIEVGPAANVMEGVSWGDGNIGNGHNAYLDIWLELGLVGLAAYTILLLTAVNRLAALLSQDDVLGPIFMVILVHISVYSITERVLLEHSALLWLLLVVLLLQATPALAPARQAIAPEPAGPSPHARR